MKRFYRYLLLILPVFTSCSHDFLELYPETTLNEGNFYSSEEEYILLANGCYVPMRNYEKVDHWVIAEIPSDNASYQDKQDDGGAWPRRVIDQFLASSSNDNYGNFWNQSYQGIRRCNKLIEELDKSTVTWNEGIKERTAGEAHFLRALYYFNLVRQFGGVPLVLAPVNSQAAIEIKRSSEDAIYEQIIADLTTAADYLARAEGVAENGRASHAAALSLLGKVYLTLHRYDDVLNTLEPVLSSPKHGLLGNYAALFNPSAKDYRETIFAIQYTEASVELANRFIFLFAPWTSGGAVTQRPNINIIGSSYGWNQPTRDLIDAFEEGDLRKEVSIAYWHGKDSDGEIRDIPYCSKYKPPVSAPDDRCSDNLPVLRYSDVLLMYAEALNELGRTSEAIPYVFQVRERAGLRQSLDGYDQTRLQALIAKERQVEFCFENQRWYDLKRTGKALEVLAGHGVREKALRPWLNDQAFDMQPYKLLAPIPVEQIVLNKIEQNEGY